MEWAIVRSGDDKEVVVLSAGICGLRMGRLRVPPYRIRGENALLVCEYDMEDDAIYSVKWYKDDEEFYRYVPKWTPPKSSYLVPGVKVDVSTATSLIAFFYIHSRIL
ncbi:hypothetical protein PR048_008125 [Dryococelus australis]|uniref:Ig-like domain-containing protein n=1 Tax=Dryococelus australis TaxID=614101 RepID=A0ABQ9HW78_9NEOP|nr:hypothetical protein PR048_008125 [Dryococelus australis]